MIAAHQTIDGDTRNYADRQADQNLRVKRYAFGFVWSLFIEVCPDLAFESVSFNAISGPGFVVFVFRHFVVRIRFRVQPLGCCLEQQAKA
jgi:hypothetical protein